MILSESDGLKCSTKEMRMMTSKSAVRSSLRMLQVKKER